jgi:hypothetical protein
LLLSKEPNNQTNEKCQPTKAKPSNLVSLTSLALPNQSQHKTTNKKQPSQTRQAKPANTRQDPAKPIQVRQTKPNQDNTSKNTQAKIANLVAKQNKRSLHYLPSPTIQQHNKLHTRSQLVIITTCMHSYGNTCTFMHCMSKTRHPCMTVTHTTSHTHNRMHTPSICIGGGCGGVSPHSHASPNTPSFAKQHMRYITLVWDFYIHDVKPCKHGYTLLVKPRLRAFLNRF